MRVPKVHLLDLPQLVKQANTLPLMGELKITSTSLVFLNLSDQYIHQLFPLLTWPRVVKPNYFAEQGVGAHISVIYPEENKKIDCAELEKVHYFSISQMITADIGPKRYFALMVNAASLLQLRRSHQLTDQLNFKGYSIGFHITIGVQKLTSQ